MRRIGLLVLIVFAVLPAEPILAQPGLQALTIQSTQAGEQTYTLTIQALALMTALTLLPAFLLMMTSFTRIVIVLAILRQAIGTAQTPSNQVIIGLALFMSLFVMSPIISEIYVSAVDPYMSEEIQAKQALGNASAPLRKFMLGQTRESDLGLFMEISGNEPVEKIEDVPYSVLDRKSVV